MYTSDSKLFAVYPYSIPAGVDKRGKTDSCVVMLGLKPDQAASIITSQQSGIAVS